jgi:hypothetical protein
MVWPGLLPPAGNVNAPKACAEFCVVDSRSAVVREAVGGVVWGES